MTGRPVIYIAGPYTTPDPAVNVRQTVLVANTLLDDGVCWPVVPHLTHLAHLIAPRPYEDWLALDMAVLERCDGLVRLPGDSPGADREVAHAAALGLPVLLLTDSWPRSTACEVDDWITAWPEAQS